MTLVLIKCLILTCFKLKKKLVVQDSLTIRLKMIAEQNYKFLYIRILGDAGNYIPSYNFLLYDYTSTFWSSTFVHLHFTVLHIVVITHSFIFIQRHTEQPNESSYIKGPSLAFLSIMALTSLS